MAIPITMLAMFAAFALATAALVATLNAQAGSVRDQDSKSALAAAEAGVSEALLHYNRIALTNAQAPCINASGQPTGLPAGSTWCAEVGPVQMTGVAGTTYTYRTQLRTEGPSPGIPTLEIVSQGNVNGVTRRVDVTAHSSSGIFPFAGGASVIGLQGINLDSNGRIAADVATNGNITLAQNASLTCTYDQVGIGHAVVPPSSGSYTVACPAATQGTVILPPVNPGTVDQTNSNGRFFAPTCGTTPACDSYSGHAPVWDPQTLSLTLTQNSTLTLGGTNYAFCSLSMTSNTALYVTPGQHTNIYILSPEYCNQASGTAQVTMDSNARIAASSGQVDVALLFVGSDTLSTRATLSSNTYANQVCQQNFVVYAPRTDVSLAQNSYFCGDLAGKTITVQSNADVKTFNFSNEYQLPNSVAQHYSPDDFIECSAATPASGVPTGGCDL